MNESSDYSSEMHNDSLSPEDVERVIDGTCDRPDLADLHGLFGEVRALAKQTGTPEPSAALAEFVGVDLTTTTEPITLPSAGETLISLAAEPHLAEPVRRKSMIGHAAAFLGTMGGKVVIGTTVAAASVGGAHATGAVDVPFLPDTEAAVIETIELPDDPDALAFFEEVDDVADVDEETSKDELDEDLVEDDALEGDAPKDEAPKDTNHPQPEKIEEGASDKTDEDKADEVEEDTSDEDKVEKEEVEPEKEVDEPKKEEPKKEEPKKEEEVEPKKDEDGKTEAEKEAQELIAALDEALHVAKDKVRAEATALIKPLEQERDGLLADLEAAHNALAEEWEPILDDLRAQLEETEDEAARAELEADIDAAETAWANARVAAELEVDPRLEEINVLFDQIETERDEELNRLIQEFFAAVEAIEKG